MELSKNDTADLEEDQKVRSFVTDFFMYYYTERDCEKVVNSFSDHVLFVGLVNDEIVSSKEEVRKIIRAQMDGVSKPIPYFVNHYIQSYCGHGFWNCYAMVDLNVVSSKWGTSRYNIRMTLSVLKTPDGYQITAAHVSESDSFRNDRNRFGKKSEPAKTTAQQELGRIMSQVVPGGIVSRYAAPGSPISIVNNQYLRMLRHSTFYDFMEDCGGLFENNIHPDDLEKFLYTEKFIMTNEKQCECEYRVRCSDGSYLWVHDTGRRAASTDGKDLIVSILTDMSDQIERIRQLERETETDELTSVYNRRGAVHHFKHLSTPYDRYAFCVIDIDNFKLINDLYGHKQGDRTLVCVARLLSEHFGKNGIVCRLGGDEFSVFIPDFSGPDSLRKQLEEIIAAFKAEVDRLCPESHSSLSVGCVYGTPPIEIEPVFDAADANLYHIKNGSKNGLYLTALP